MVLAYRFSTSTISSAENLGNSVKPAAVQSMEVVPQPLHPVTFTQAFSVLIANRLNITNPTAHVDVMLPSSSAY